MYGKNKFFDFILAAMIFFDKKRVTYIDKSRFY